MSGAASVAAGRGPWHERAAPWIFGVAAVLALVAHVRIDGGLIDDAFITFRHAANLAEGRGMLYNPGERVLGSTTPGWTLTLGAAGALFGAAAIPLAARLLNGLLLVGAGLVARRLVGSLGGSRLLAALAGALVMVGTYDLTSGVAGMETPLFNLLVLGALLGLAEGRWLLAAGAAGLAPVVRPEGALIAAVVGVAWLVALRRPGAARRGRGLAVPPLLVGPGVVALVAMGVWYGSPVPQSIRAKRAGIYPLTVAESALETVTALRGGLTGAGLVDVLVPGLHLLALAAGTVWLVARVRRAWPAAVLLWVPLAFYATSKTLVFPHYVALVEPFALAAWGAAIHAVLARVVPWAAARLPGPVLPAPRLRPVVLAVTGAILLVRPLATYPVASVLRGGPDPSDVVVGPPMLRLAFYRAAAEVVGPAIPPGTTVLMPEIGVPGFYMPHVRVLDAAGLVSPEAVAFLPVPPEERVGSAVGAVPRGLVRAEGPELVLTLELFARRSLYEDPWFDARYETVWRWGADDLVWGPLRIHARRGSPIGARLRELPGGVAGPRPGG